VSIEEIKQEIVERLKAVNPSIVVLFGSYAYGKPDKNSDVDLLVVTDDDFIPNSFREKNAIYLRVSNTITDLEKRIPIDLIVQTKPMHRKFIELGSMFSRMIAAKGIVLYEKSH